MTFAAQVDRIIGEAVAEMGISTPQEPMSAELHRFIDAIRRKAREGGATDRDPRNWREDVMGEDIRIDR